MNYTDYMTKEDQISELSKLDGWTYSGFTWTSPNGSRYADRVKRLTSHSPLELIPLDQILPAYLTSYDAIIPLVQKQPVPVQRMVYREAYSMDRQRGYPHVNESITSLCEALLRATGRWRE